MDRVSGVVAVSGVSGSIDIFVSCSFDGVYEGGVLVLEIYFFFFWAIASFSQQSKT